MPFLEDALVEEPENEFDPDSLLEAIADQQPGGGENFSLDQSEAVVVYVYTLTRPRPGSN